MLQLEPGSFTVICGPPGSGMLSEGCLTYLPMYLKRLACKSASEPRIPAKLAACGALAVQFTGMQKARQQGSCSYPSPADAAGWGLWMWQIA